MVGRRSWGIKSGVVKVEIASVLVGSLALALPLDFVVVNVHTPFGIEQVRRVAKSSRNRLFSHKPKVRTKGEPHMLPLIGDRRSTVRTTHFGRKLSMSSITARPSLVYFRVIKVQVMQRRRLETNILLCKHGNPLKWRSVERLAGTAMTDFGTRWITSHFIGDSTTETGSLVSLDLQFRVFKSHQRPKIWQIRMLQLPGLCIGSNRLARWPFWPDWDHHRLQSATGSIVPQVWSVDMYFSGFQELVVL